MANEVKIAGLYHGQHLSESVEESTCESCKYSTPYTVNGGVCGKFKAWFCLFDAIEDGYNNLEQIEPSDKPCEVYTAL